MKTYTADRAATGRRIIVRDDAPTARHPIYDLDPKASQKIINHSPDGFEWGYHGSGPAQLALAILLDAGMSKGVAQGLYQDFKSAFVAVADQAGFMIHEADITCWVRARATPVDIP